MTKYKESIKGYAKPPLLLKLKLRVVNNRLENLTKVEALPMDDTKD